MSAPANNEAQSGIQRVFQSREETRSYYNKIAQFYDLLAEHSEGPIRESGLKLLDAAKGERVLEIGSGTGHCLIELAQAVGTRGRVYGLDLSDRMVDLAQELVRKQNLTEIVELKCGDAEHLPYDPDILNAIFMSFTLELFDTPDIPLVLAECRRVLKPGGRIVVAAVSHEGEPGLALHVYEWTHRHFPNFLDCRPIFARRALETAGFLIRKVELGQMWVPVEIVLAVKPD